MVTFLVAENDLGIFDEIMKECPEQVHCIKIEDSLDGQSMMQLVIELCTITIPLVEVLIINNWNNKKVIIEIEGKKITVFLKELPTLEQLGEFLRSICG